MKFLCETCQRLAAPTAWSVAAGRLRITCLCGASSELGPLSRASDDATPGPLGPVDAELAAFLSEPTQVPFARSAEAQAEVAQSAGAQGAVPLAALALEHDEWLEAGWSKLLRNWSDFALHQRLIAEAAARGEFAALGQRYKEHLQRQPDDAVALSARDELIGKASAQLLSALPAEERSLSRGTAITVRNFLLALFVVGVLGFGAFVLSNLP